MRTSSLILQRKLLFGSLYKIVQASGGQPVTEWIRDDQPMIVRPTQEKSSTPFETIISRMILHDN